jgi:excisionase family DNA binding protein
MAKMFYTAEEAAKRLGTTEEALRKMVREGTLREFRDAGTFNYKVDDVEELAAAAGGGGQGSGGLSTSGEIVLEPVDDSSVEPAPSSGSDVLSLEEVDAADTTAGARAAEKKKEGSVVPSVGVNVFDDEELDEAVDPLAQTAVTDLGGLGLEGSGSGSGILDLTRESDDTSLGAELLEEIYTDEAAPATAEGDVEMGEDTKAGLEAISEPAEGEEPFQIEAEPAAAAAPKVVVRETVEYGPDAWSTSLTALMIVAVVVMWIAGLAGAAMVRGVAPGIVRAVYDNLAIFVGGACVVGLGAAAVTFFLAKRSG